MSDEYVDSSVDSYDEDNEQISYVPNLWFLRINLYWRRSLILHKQKKLILLETFQLNCGDLVVLITCWRDLPNMSYMVDDLLVKGESLDSHASVF